MNNHEKEVVTKAIKKALRLKSTTGLSLFNARRVNDYLRQEDVILEHSKITILSYDAIYDNYNTNFAVNNLYKDLIDNPNFEHCFLNDYLMCVNEYQLKEFCEIHSIHYPKNLSWKPIIFKILKLHAQRKYPEEFKEFTKLKNEQQKYFSKIPEIPELPQHTKENTMPTETHSNVASHINNSTSFDSVTTTIVYKVNDKNINYMSKEELFEQAIRLQTSIKNLRSLNIKSKAVKKEIKKQKKTQKQVIKYLDNKYTS